MTTLFDYTNGQLRAMLQVASERGFRRAARVASLLSGDVPLMDPPAADPPADVTASTSPAPAPTDR